MEITIIGSGVVGGATGKGLAALGNEVTFVDTNENTVDKLNRSGFKAYSMLTPSMVNDIVMLCVPTPSKENGSVDLSYINSAIVNLGNNLKSIDHYTVIVIRSTVPPMTTRCLVLSELEKASGKKVGKDFGLCMQPEFLREVSNEADFSHPWLTVIGEFDHMSGDFLEKIYNSFDCKIYRVSLEEAEFMKYVHNCFNAVKISFSNEIWMLGNKLGINANFVLEMASQSAEGYWNSRYGIVGGHSYGGKCLPKDTKGLKSFANSLHIELPLLDATIEVNDEVNDYAIDKVNSKVNDMVKV